MFRFTVRDLLWLAVVVACTGLRADEPGPTLKQLIRQASEEPETIAFQNFLRAMSHHTGRIQAKQSQLLVVSWFPDKFRDKNGQCILRYAVTDTGDSHSRRTVFRYSNEDIQATEDTRLSADQLKALRGLLKTLPESKAEPPIERTVHVSFQSGDKWQTQTYDASALPAEFEKVLLIVGERFETKDRHRKK